jgi:hypothetical protein
MNFQFSILSFILKMQGKGKNNAKGYGHLYI